MYLKPKRLSGNVDSTSSTLTAGDGILIEGSVVKVDDSVVAKDSELPATLTAGNGILIEEGAVKADGSVVAQLASDNAFTGGYNKFTGVLDKRKSDDSGVFTVSDSSVAAYQKLTVHGGLDVVGGDVSIQRDINITGTHEIKRGSVWVFDQLLYLWRYNVLREDWTNVALNASLTAGIGNNPISVVTGDGRPPNVQFLKIPYVKTTGSLPLQYIIKARGMVNLGGATANGPPHGDGDASTAKSVVLTTITNAQLIPKYTYSFTVNGFSAARRARVDLYGTEHPTVAERGRLVFVFGGSDIGIQHIDLGQLEWMTN
jgi:hypothetical protein